MKELEISFLGTRGTMPVTNKEYEIFGGATVCVLIKSREKNIVLDAGSGFMDVDKCLNENENELNLLISHPHIDHIMGLLASKIMFNSKMIINIYAVKRNGISIKDQINALMREPIWPVNSSAFLAKVNFIDIENSFEIGDFKIDVKEGNHTGDSSIFKIEYNNKKVIYATDFEIDNKSLNTLVEFSNGADFLICDGQYSSQTIKEKVGYGHSAWQDSVKVANMAKVDSMCIFHHDPYSSDEYLLQIETKIKKENQKYFLARKGAVINL